MEHIPGGYYTGRKPCRCDSCKADHARRARGFRQDHPNYQGEIIKSLRAEVAELRAWVASAPSGERVSP